MTKSPETNPYSGLGLMQTHGDVGFMEKGVLGGLMRERIWGYRSAV